MNTTDLPSNLDDLSTWMATRRVARFSRYENERNALKDFYGRELDVLNKSEQEEYQKDLVLLRAKEKEIKGI